MCTHFNVLREQTVYTEEHVLPESTLLYVGLYSLGQYPHKANTPRVNVVCTKGEGQNVEKDAFGTGGQRQHSSAQQTSQTVSIWCCTNEQWRRQAGAFD